MMTKLESSGEGEIFAAKKIDEKVIMEANCTYTHSLLVSLVNYDRQIIVNHDDKGTLSTTASLGTFLFVSKDMR